MLTRLFYNTSVRNIIQLYEFLRFIPMSANNMDLPGRSSDKCDSEESLVVFFQMTTSSLTTIRSTSSFDPSVIAERQLSEGSDDSIVFCSDNSEEEAETEDDSCDEDSEGNLSLQPDSGFEEKKVQFNLHPKVYVIRAWDFAYRQARKGEWEMAARDRERFKKRIQETGNILSSVFDKNLRDKVYEERFSSTAGGEPM
nr:uncharacterized protein LOC109425646 [Aedes albopictus]